VNALEFFLVVCNQGQLVAEGMGRYQQIQKFQPKSIDIVLRPEDMNRLKLDFQYIHAIL
jgi:hypothetical protein